MQLKILSRRTLPIVILMGFLLSLAILFYFIPKSSAQSGSAPLIENAFVLPKQEQAGSGLPVRLRIPKINIDSPVEYAGLTPDGAMDIRKSSDAIAWFSLGTRPGDIGSAVISGHYGYWKTGKIALFYKLDKLRRGDKIYIEDDKGATIVFVVGKIKTYDSNADASNVFGSNDGKAHLNLITCSGAWDAVSRSYPERLVVFSDKE